MICIYFPENPVILIKLPNFKSPQETYLWWMSALSQQFVTFVKYISSERPVLLKDHLVASRAVSPCRFHCIWIVCSKCKFANFKSALGYLLNEWCPVSMLCQPSPKNKNHCIYNPKLEFEWVEPWFTTTIVAKVNIFVHGILQPTCSAKCFLAPVG